MTLPGERVGKLELRTFCKVWEVVSVTSCGFRMEERITVSRGFCLNRKHTMNSEQRGHTQGSQAHFLEIFSGININCLSLAFMRKKISCGLSSC